ncbi:putative inactive polypeptide N-acetylgalactosaminyltransferase 12 [Drosophila biarmipes]|uniref:putative inactive polypeptide N-acetylgalactosaminyltransferase 12 n=1 Tax=Drosophila biarmipes TaxID=125945 RepID=UPI0007E65F05|nr:putative inactive polypeptide N-acetylgalactosaminyltransferase 12 [Drosophila biarmipes]
MELSPAVLKYSKYVFFLLWVLMVLLLLHRDLSRWDGLMGALSHPGLGENGTASYLGVPSLEIDAYTQGWQRYAYNSWLAERISLWRTLPDLRDPRCLNLTYAEDEMKPVSVILIFRNEQLVVLLRTLHSLVDRTPKHLFSELIILNDYSDVDFWKDKLSLSLFDSYVIRYIHPKARIMHLKEHMGLIQARVLASKQAKADNLVFIDAQVEFTKGWLTPLLSTISDQSLTLATPILDELDERNLAYHRSVEMRGIFDWSLRRREVPLPEHARNLLPRPYNVALARTSVFAIPAQWFQDLSHFDRNLRGSGAAELELSFKVWRTGGRIVRVPCSRVGHLQPKDQDYLKRYGSLHYMGKELLWNLKRIVEIWIDDQDLKSIIYKYNPDLVHFPLYDLSKSFRLFEDYDCQSFKSFIKEVMPELGDITPTNRSYYSSGLVKPLEFPKSCLTIHSERQTISLEPCKTSYTLQIWSLTYLHDLRIAKQICAEVQPDLKLGFDLCHMLGGRQSWHYDALHNHLVSNTKCLELGGQFNMFLAQCDKSNRKQRWILDNTNMSVMQSENN